MTIKQHGGVFGRNPAFNDVSVETLSIAGTALASTAAELNILDGVTADATEINYLDGASTSVVTASKAVLANASANIAFASGKGIDFSATGDGSGTTDNELFDDYEEGVFEPSFGGSTSDPTVTYDNPNETSGIYRKVGSLVFFSISIRTDSATGGSGRLLIKGLPFTCATGLGESASCSVYVGFSSSFGTNPTAGSVEANTTQIGLRYRATHNADSSNSDVTHLSNSANSNYIYIAGTYVAA